MIKINDFVKEILSSLIGFLLAAFDTSSATLSFCLFCLLKYPNALEKLQEEVDLLESVYKFYLMIKLSKLNLNHCNF